MIFFLYYFCVSIVSLFFVSISMMAIPISLVSVLTILAKRSSSSNDEDHDYVSELNKPSRLSHLEPEKYIHFCSCIYIGRNIENTKSDLR